MSLQFYVEGHAMPNRTMTIAAMLFSLAGASQALAQSQGVAAPSREERGESSNQSAKMGPSTGNKDGANNGIGTEGSLDHDAGTASSTVAGMKGGTAGFGGGTPNKGAAVTTESDPVLGGGKAPK